MSNQAHTEPTGYNANAEGVRNITAPSPPEAVAWDGWKSGSIPLKPSAESILHVTKPGLSPGRRQVQEHGVGGYNVEACRIPHSEPCRVMADQPDYNKFFGQGGRHGETLELKPAGRYPSNLLVTARAMGDASKYADLDRWAEERGVSADWLDRALSAGVCEVAKPSRREKNAGCGELEERDVQSHGNITGGGRQFVAPDGTLHSQGNAGPSRNHHPTTKPVTLMSWLIALACPEGGLVMDPFLGSATTAVAAIQLNRRWVGAELTPEYWPIIEARIAHAEPATPPQAQHEEPAQGSLF